MLAFVCRDRRCHATAFVNLKSFAPQQQTSEHQKADEKKDGSEDQAENGKHDRGNRCKKQLVLASLNINRREISFTWGRPGGDIAFLLRRQSGDPVVDDFASDIGEKEIPILEAIGELEMVESDLMEHGVVKVVVVNWFVDNVPTDFIGLAVGQSALQSAAGH